MPQAVIAAEPVIRLSCFAGVLLLMALWELLLPRRPQAVSRLLRWPNNLGLVVLDTLAVRLLFPLAAVGMAFLAQTKGWGLLNMIALPAWFAVPAAVLLLDLVIYGQHVVFHAVPLLWRLHRMHHADLECDVTTGLRFHPGEIVLSMAHQARGRPGARRTAAGRARVRGAAQCNVHVQPRQCPLAPSA